MKIIGGVRYYSKREVADLVGRSPQTIVLWDKWSEEEEAKGAKRLIPAPMRIGSGDYRFWNDDDIEAIKLFANTIERGSLAEYSRQQWGARGKKEEQ